MRLFKSLGTDAGGSGGVDSVGVIVTTKGIQQSRQAIGRIRRATNKAGAKGLRKALRYILAESNRITPKKTGALRKSGTVSVFQTEPEPKGAILYGVHYAIYVHEDLTKHHAAGTSAKFLEKTVKNRRVMSKARIMIAEDIALAQRKVV